jgi:glycosyltransferase involved in cell wall biosynthesis
LAQLARFEELDIELACLPEYHWRDQSVCAVWPGLFSISHQLPLVRKARFLLAQFINPRRLLQRSVERGVDLIHLCNINYLSFVDWEPALERWGGKLACTAHDVRRGAAILNRSFEERQLQRFYRRCDAVFVHSEQQGMELQEFAAVPAERVHVVPHGPHQYADQDENAVEKLRGKLGLDGSETVALFFGFLREDKNLHAYLRAMAQFTNSPVYLIVAGNVAAQSRKYVQDCRDLVEDLDLGNRVHFEVRYIADEEVPQWFGVSDFVVCAHAESFSSQSGVLNLAAFYEKPVLATPSASIRELLQEADIGVLCGGFREHEISEGIHAITKRLQQGPSFDFDTYRQRYSWGRNAELTRAVYHQLLEAA